MSQPALNRLMIVTDAWRPQINGVVRSIERLILELNRRGIETDVISPLDYRTLPMPSYPEISLSLAGKGSIRRRLDAFRPDAVHIATEGPLGMLARSVALEEGRDGFTTCYHTKFPEYLAERLPVPLSWSFALLRRFHNAGHGCMVASDSLRKELAGHGFRNLMIWSRGVDTALFHPRPESVLDLPRPIFLNVGRVAVEKNLEAFCALDLPGSKVVVGDGPQLTALKKAYPDVHFLGSHTGEDLAALYASADVFVFPSRTDTFGNVLIEALASGVPVAAFPVMGPNDVIGTSGAGVLSENLKEAALRALDIPREAAIAHARGFTWEHSTDQFVANVTRRHAVSGAVLASVEGIAQA